MVVEIRNQNKFVLTSWNFEIDKVSSIVILRQDKRVVLTQLPKKSEFKMDERLIMGDKPIIEYRKHRQKLMDLNVKMD
jgi:hypothetical protein